MKWNKSTLDSFDSLDPFAKPDRSDVFTDDFNINALVAELTDDCNIFLATFLSLLTFDHFIFTLHSHSCFTCSSISCSLINWNALKQKKIYKNKKNKTENEFQSMTASQGNQSFFFSNVIIAFYRVFWSNLTQFYYFTHFTMLMDFRKFQTCLVMI